MTIYLLKRTQEPALIIEESGDYNHPAILFIHGFSQSRHIWIKQIKSFLAKEFRLIAIDLRGHGDSEKTYNQYYNAKTWANDIHSILNFLKLERVVVCAWSYAALIICDYLKFYGEGRLAGINFIAPFFNNGSQEDEDLVSKQVLSILSKLISSDFSTNVLATIEMIKCLTYKKTNTKEFHYILGTNLLCPHYVRESLLKRKANNRKLIKNITLPLLLSHGDKDQIIHPVASLNQQILTPHAKLSIYKDIGHTLFWEASSRFNNELNRFAKCCFDI